MNREGSLEAKVAAKALAGDLEAARELARLEAALSFTTNLGECPAAEEAYDLERAKSRAAPSMYAPRAEA